ncbi:unnamed protein product [Pedinophyceae sp. YPF-701]|nr:unnamed protein product [Pedinophyceae sp. YPF-701]
MDVHGQAAATWAPEYVGAADGAMMYSGGYLGPAAVVGAGGQGGLGHGYGPGMYCGPEMAGHGDPYGPRHASRPPPPAAPEHYADKAQARKARNRESAKRSRQKRQDEFDRLERENRALLERVQNMRSQLQWSFQAALAEAGRRAAGAGGEGGVCGRCRRAGGIRRTGSM